MKNIISISFVFIGLVIGAGFASGREIFEYFCLPTQTDFIGTLIAAIGFGATCYIIMQLSQKCNTENFDGLIRNITGRFAPMVQIFMTLFMFCGFFIMMSACGVLAEETFNIPSFYGILFLALVCFVVFSFNIKGLVIFNTILVPIMISGMVYICLVSTLATLPVFASFEEIKTTPITSSLCYVSYNTITAGAVLVPLSKYATKKQIAISSIISGTILGILIFIGWISMNRIQGLSGYEMPLLELAARENDVAKKLYTLVLFMALCTTAVSHGFGILSKFSFSKTSHRIIAATTLCVTAIPFAGFGFSSLVSNIYSAFGYIGFIWTAILIWKYIKS